MSRPLHILMLSHAADDPNGGASRIYHMLASALRDRGHTVDLHHLDDFGLPRGTIAAKIACRFALPHYVSRFGAGRDPGRYDVVMSSSGMAAPLFKKLAARKERPLLVNHLHGLAIYDHIANTTENMLGHYPTRLAYRLVTGPFQAHWDLAGIRFADLNIVQNLRDLSWVRPRTREGAETRMIAASVHPDVLAASREAASPESRRPDRLLWFASWESRKGSYYVPQAFRMIRERHPSAELTIGGAGRSEADMRGHFDPQDQGHVHVLPRLTIAEQASCFANASIFLFPSLSEGFGLALVEAMAFGLAAVTTNTAFGGDYLTDGRTARVVFPSSEHIARAVNELIGSDATRHRIAEAGRTLAQGFTLERMVDAYEAAFFNVRKRIEATAG
jgi:glycosyltransferase involved in cell wall biosynthesis